MLTALIVKTLFILLILSILPLFFLKTKATKNKDGNLPIEVYEVEHGNLRLKKYPNILIIKGGGKTPTYWNDRVISSKNGLLLITHTKDLKGLINEIIYHIEN